MDLRHVHGGAGDEDAAAVTVQVDCHGSHEARHPRVHLVPGLQADDSLRHGHQANRQSGIGLGTGYGRG